MSAQVVCEVLCAVCNLSGLATWAACRRSVSELSLSRTVHYSEWVSKG